MEALERREKSTWESVQVDMNVDVSKWMSVAVDTDTRESLHGSS